jgi:hypothetical protein
MENQTPVEKLKEAIRILEVKQSEEGLILKDQFRQTFESLKPSNLIKSTIKDLTSSSEIKNGIFETVFSLLSGFAARKMLTESKSNSSLNFLGSIIQYVVASLVAKNAEPIRLFLVNTFDHLISDQEEATETEPK